MSKKILNLLFAIFIFVHIASAQGYKIKVKINSLHDTTLLLAHHFGDKKFIDDTAKVDHKGQAVFEKKKLLPGGIYIIVLPSKKYFDVLIDKDQNFSIENDTTDLFRKIKTTGNNENKQFYDYQYFMSKLADDSRTLQRKAEKLKSKPDSFKIVVKKIDIIDSTAKTYSQKLIHENPNALLSKIIKATTAIDVPDPPKDKHGNVLDSLFQYRYYKAHYFDNFDFSDARILRTPVFEPKLMTFVKDVLYQIPDSLIPELDKVIQKSMVNQEMYQFVLGNIFNHYNASKIMGIDAVFVHIADTYYLNGKAPWSDTTLMKELRKRVDKMRPNLIGKQAPELKLVSIDNRVVSLYAVESKFTILVFWEPTCGHCQKEIPKLFQMYQKVRTKGVEVLAVHTQTDTTEWKKFVRKYDMDWINVYDPFMFSNFHELYDIYSTPTIYLLDEKKKILAKRMGVDQLEDMLNKLLKIK